MLELHRKANVHIRLQLAAKDTLANAQSYGKRAAVIELMFIADRGKAARTLERTNCQKRCLCTVLKEQGGGETRCHISLLSELLRQL